MTEQQAIETIKYASAFNRDNSPLTIALNVAIEALEKQIPMKPKISSFGVMRCPKCLGKVGEDDMERLTRRVPTPDDCVVVYTKGMYRDTIPAEMSNTDIRTVLRALADYEDLEEQGRLRILPCKVGDEVFVIGAKYRAGRNETWINTGKFMLSDLERLGKTVFLTKEEAKEALAKMKGGAE